MSTCLANRLDDGFEQVVLDDVASDVALAAAGVAGEQAGAVVHRGDARADAGLARRLHLADHLHQEQQLAVAGAGGGVLHFFVAPVVLEPDLEARVDDLAILLDELLLAGPALAVGRVGEHEVEAAAGELVDRQG